jgi:hypothetical protein
MRLVLVYVLNVIAASEGESGAFLGPRAHYLCAGDGAAGDLAADALVYGAGTLKNVSTLQANQVALVDAGVFPVLLRLLHGCCDNTGNGGGGGGGGGGRDRPKSASSRPRSASQRPRPAAGVVGMGAGMTAAAAGGGGGNGMAAEAGGEANEAAQLTVQLTGTLRNLVVLSGHVGLLLRDARAVATLTALVRRFVAHAELMLNVARIFSKLSMDDAARRVLGKDEETLRQLLQLLRVHPDHSAMVRSSSLALRCSIHVKRWRDLCAVITAPPQPHHRRMRWPSLVNRITKQQPAPVVVLNALGDTDVTATVAVWVTTIINTRLLRGIRRAGGACCVHHGQPDGGQQSPASHSGTAAGRRGPLRRTARPLHMASTRGVRPAAVVRRARASR